MSTALATIQQDDLETMQRTAAMMLASGFFGPQANRDTGIAQIAVKIMAGREMGYGPFASVRGIHVIQGTPALSANLMAAAVKAHPRYDYRVRKMDDTEVVIEFFEIVNGKRESLGTSNFTLADAKKAQTKNLDKFARNMLFARAMSNGVRWFCPDVFSGNAVYVPEELGAEVDGETGEILEGRFTEVKATSGKATNGKAPAQPVESVEMPPLDELEPLDYEAGQGEAQAARPNWSGPPEAQAWAVAKGYCANEFEARNSFKKIVDADFGGKLTTGNMGQVFDAYYTRQMEKGRQWEQETAENSGASESDLY